MGKVIKKQLQGMSWWARISLVALLTLVITVLTLHNNKQPIEAAPLSSSGVLTALTTTGSTTITGLPFQPKAVIFYWAKQTTTNGTYAAGLSHGYGFAAGSPIGNASVSNAVGDAITTPTDAATYQSNASSIVLISAAGNAAATATEAAVTAFTADGFTVNFSKVDGTADAIYYVALGGADLTNATVGTTSMFALTGNSAVTGVGFQPDSVMLLSSNRSITLNTFAADSRAGMTLGFMTPTQQASMSWGDRGAQLAYSGGSLIDATRAYNALRGNAIDTTATFSAMGVDGFTLNATVAGGAQNVAWLALKGGNYAVGAHTQPTSVTTSSVTGMSFKPTALFMAGINATTADGTVNTTTSKISIGSATAVGSERAIWAQNSGYNTSDANRTSTTAKAFRNATNPSTTNSEANLQSFNNDGFTLNWTSADATARRMIYFAIGGPGTTAPTLTTPTATTIASTTATLGANVTADGGSAVTERGVVWNTVTAPTTANNKVTGTGTTGAYTVSASTLPANTRIFYRGYAINSVGTSYSPEGSFYTEPSTQANTVLFSNVTQAALTVGWNRGNGANVIVVMKSGSAVDTAPADGNDSYTAQAAFGTGSVTGGTNYVVYKGNGTSVTVTGLTASTTYHVAVYEYSGSGNDVSPALGINYLLTPATSSQGTLAPCAAGTPTALTVGTETTSAVPLTWTTGAATDYFIVYRNGSQYATNVLSPSFTDSSVTPGANNTYTVSGYNNAGTCSSAQTAAVNAYVIPLVPAIPTTANPGTGTTLNVTIGTDTNDSSVQYAIRVGGTQYVQSSGALGGTPFWQSKSNWGTKTVTGLTSNTDYTFDVAARNINPTPDTTAYGPSKLQRTTITLPTTITSCTGCHENPPTDTGISTRSGGEFAGSHSKHAVTLGQACTICHVNNGTSYNHSNGLIQMAGSGASYTKGASFAINNVATLTGGTCSSLYCHSNGTGGTSQAGETRALVSLTTPNWGGTTTCTTCHGNPPSYANYTSTAAVAGSKANAHQGTTHLAQLCTVCHDTTTGNHGNGLYSINGSLGYTYNARRGGTCATAGCHGSVNWGGKLGCVDCHKQTYVRTKGRVGATLAAATNEFGLAYGHKKTGRATVADADCIVCHLEGDFTTQKPSATFHSNGNIDLRNPDGTGEEPIKDINNAAWTFARFSTSYATGSKTSTGHTSNNVDNVITQKFCLKCHDKGGATNTYARSNNGGTGTATMPFGGINLGATYTVLNGASVTGGIVNVFSQFSTANSSVHPVRKPNNHGLPTAARMNAPYKPSGTRVDAGTTKTDSIVLSCFDCHNNYATLNYLGKTGLLTLRTNAAHGTNGTAASGGMLRGTFYVNTPSLCIACHAGYNTAPGTSGTHGAGSAQATALDGGENMLTVCHNCHASTTAVPARPIKAFDYHGYNKLLSGNNWPTGGLRPYAFIRNTTNFAGTGYHRPARSSEFAAGSATCMGGTGCAGNGTVRTYTPGGQY